MKPFAAAVALLAASLASPASAGEVKLQVANGRITLQARDATVREILAEWARVGQVTVINGEKVGGPPVTLEFQGLPEAQALGTLLRSISGYMASTKLQPGAGASIYDRIVILATPRTAVATAAYTAPSPPQQQGRGGFPGMPNPAMLDDQDEPAGVPPAYPGMGMPPGYAPPGRNPALQMPQAGMSGGAPGVAASPAAGTIPQGVPGTVSPMPQIPGTSVQPGLVIQPGTGAPGTVTQPVKKPGGPGGPGDGDSDGGSGAV